MGIPHPPHTCTHTHSPYLKHAAINLQQAVIFKRENIHCMHGIQKFAKKNSSNISYDK